MREIWSGWMLVAVLLLVGCGFEKETKTTTVRKSSSDPLLDRYASNYDYQKTDDGSTKVVSGQRSDFEGARATTFDKGVQVGSFRGERVDKSPWWGRKGYQQQVWNGSRGASEGTRVSRFGSKRSSTARRTAHVDDRSFGTGGYRTGTAGEQGAGRLGKPSDAMSANRREDYPSPAIIGWEQKRQMDVEQTKGILGR